VYCCGGLHRVQVLYVLVAAFALLYSLILLLDYGYFSGLAQGLFFVLARYTPVKILM
jgi:hypothetical protein